MSDNENIEAKLCSYVEGDLDAAGRAEIEKYLLAHPQYRPLIAELARTRGLLQGLPRESAPAELMETLSGQIERSVLLGDDDAGAMRVRSNPFPHLAAWAAVLVLTAGLAAVVYRVLPSNKTQPEIALLKPAPPAVSATQEMSDDSIRVLNDLDKSVSAQPGPQSGAQSNLQPLGGGAMATEASVVAMAPAATAPSNDQVAAATQQVVSTDAMATTAQAIASADANVVSGGTVASGIAAPQPASAIVGGDAMQSGQNLYVTLHATDAKAADARVTQYLSNNGIQYESREMDRGLKLSSGPLAPLMPSGNGPQNHMIGTQSAEPANQLTSSGMSAARATAAAAFNPEAPMRLGKLIIARNLSPDQAKRLASDLDVKVLPAQVNLQASTQPLAMDGAGVPGDAPLQAGERVLLIAREKLLPDVDAMNETETIDADGNLTLPLVGKMQAAGLTMAELAQKIPQAYRDAKSPTDANWVITRVAATMPVAGDLSLSPATPAAAATAPAVTGAISSVNGGAADQHGIDVTIRVIGQAAPATAPAAALPEAAADGGATTAPAAAAAGNNPALAAPPIFSPAATMPTTMPGG